jgi:hypothetical protein
VADACRYGDYVGLSRGTFDKQIQSFLNVEALLNDRFESYVTLCVTTGNLNM